MRSVGRGSRGGARARGSRAARDQPPHLVGRDAESADAWTRAHHAFLGRGRGPGGGPLRVLAGLTPADPGRDGAQRRLARAGPAAARRGPARLRGARVSAVPDALRCMAEGDICGRVMPPLGRPPDRRALRRPGSDGVRSARRGRGAPQVGTDRGGPGAARRGHGRGHGRRGVSDRAGSSTAP